MVSQQHVTGFWGQWQARAQDTENMLRSPPFNKGVFVWHVCLSVSVHDWYPIGQSDVQTDTSRACTLILELDEESLDL